MTNAGARNKVMKLLDMKGFDLNIIEDPSPYTVYIGKYQKYGDIIKNSIDSYALRDMIVFVMKDKVCVEKALAMGATMSNSKKL